MEVIIIIALGWFLYANHQRTNRLEEEMRRLRRPEGTHNDVLPPIPHPPAPPLDEYGRQLTPFTDENPDQYDDAVWQPASGEDSAGRFVAWLKQDFLMKLGAFLILLALGWFVSYAFANDWIGPNGRITLGILLGVGCMLLGAWRIREFRHQGGIFTVLGATIVLLTIFAARELYDMFTPFSALVLMFATVTFVAFVSVRYESERLAMASLFLGALAPLLTAVQIMDVMMLFPYLMVLTAGTLWVVWWTGWTRLTFIALVLTYFHTLPFLPYYAQGQDQVLMFSFLFVGIFFLANLVSLVRRREDDRHLGIHAMTALGTVVFLFTWIQSAAVEEWRSLLYIAWALVFSLGTYVVFVATANYKAFYLYGGTALSLIGMATAAEFDGPVLTVAFTLEILALLFAVSRIVRQDLLMAWLSWLFLVPVSLSLESLVSSEWRHSVLHEHFFVLVLLMLALTVAGLLIRSLHTEQSEPHARVMAGLWLVGGLFYASSLAWLVPHALFTEDTATMLSLIVYTITGIGLYVQGRTVDNLEMRFIGGAYITFVVARLLLVEVADMALEGRIITFFVIGVLLISTAFIRKLHTTEAVSYDNEGSNPNQ